MALTGFISGYWNWTSHPFHHSKIFPFPITNHAGKAGLSRKIKCKGVYTHIYIYNSWGLRHFIVVVVSRESLAITLTKHFCLMTNQCCTCCLMAAINCPTGLKQKGRGEKTRRKQPSYTSRMMKWFKWLCSVARSNTLNTTMRTITVHCNLVLIVPAWKWQHI